MSKVYSKSTNEVSIPVIPDTLIIKADSLFDCIGTQHDSLGNKLEKIYSYLDEFKLFFGKYKSCSSGCGHCCKMTVKLSILEAEYIQIKTANPVVRGTTVTSGHKDNCPFLLENESCGIYNYRSVVCRIFYAFGDPKNCDHGKMQIQ